jgi:hypothetical protein
MPAARKKSTSKKAVKRGRSTAAKKSSPAHTSLETLNNSLEAAQTALSELGGSLSQSGRGLLKDVQKQIGDARRTTRKVNRSILSEIERLQGAITSRTPGSGSSRKSSAKRKVTATRKAGAAKRTKRAPAKRATASKARKS